MANKFNEGSVVFQMSEMFKHSGIVCIGESKHDAKEQIRAELKAEGISPTLENVSARLGIYSGQTYTKYLKIGVELAKFCNAKENGYNVKSIENIKGKHIEAFINSKLDDGISRNYFQQITAACVKVQTALNWSAEKFSTGKEYHWGAAIERVREVAYANYGEKETYTRHYDNPTGIIDNMSGKTQTAAEIQFYGVTRISEACSIKLENFKGIIEHPVLGRVGIIAIESDTAKGGKERLAYVPVDVYNKAHVIAEEKGSFRVDHSSFRDNLKDAAGDQYKGRQAHGMRWSGCVYRYETYVQSGYTKEQALAQTSKDMGHERISITSWYLWGGRR